MTVVAALQAEVPVSAILFMVYMGKLLETDGVMAN
jgi:hypothetical protein